MRFGLVGTGYWAGVNHAPALSATPGVEFVGIWGRNSSAAAKLAGQFRVRSYSSFDQLVKSVDALVFAIAPDAQVALASRAVESRKHVLLEKPVALSGAAADALVKSIEDNEVSSLVFLTGRFRPEIQDWVEASSQHCWTSARGNWLTSGLVARDSPWKQSRWRWEKGALWDHGPHALSLVLPIMGPVVNVAAFSARGDVTHLLLTHKEGRTSSLTFGLRAPKTAILTDLRLSEASNVAIMPEIITSARGALQNALETLTQLAESGVMSHACDVRFGRDIVRILEIAESHIDATC